MDEIALEAGVNKAMLYYYYSSKELLYREVLAVEFVKGNAVFLAEPLFAEAGNARKKVEKFVDIAFEISDDFLSGKLMFQAMANEPDALERGIKTGAGENRHNEDWTTTAAIQVSDRRRDSKRGVLGCRRNTACRESCRIALDRYDRLDVCPQRPRPTHRATRKLS